MGNQGNKGMEKRPRVRIGTLEMTQLHLRNPYIVAWWSAAFPGFGHLLLSMNVRGFILFIWEVVINVQAGINAAMIYSFQGEIELAKESLNTRWLLIYIPVYLFAIWDSYRTTVDMNKIYLLAERDEQLSRSFKLGSFEINYLEKREPLLAIIWSLFAPGLGHLYLHRIITSFFIIIWTVAFFYYSHGLEAISLLFLGKIAEATAIVKPEWLLFFPSIYGFAAFDAYMNTVENNKLYEEEQQNFLRKNYQAPTFQLLKGQKVK